MQYPAILITKEKHVEGYYILHSKEDYISATAKIIRERIELGLIDVPSLDELQTSLTNALEKLKTPYGNLSTDEIEALPAPIKQNVKDTISKNEKRIALVTADFNKEKQVVTLLTKIKDAADVQTAAKLRTRNGTPVSLLIFEVLSERDEYSKYEIVHPSSIS